MLYFNYTRSVKGKLSEKMGRKAQESSPDNNYLEGQSAAAR